MEWVTAIIYISFVLAILGLIGEAMVSGSEGDSIGGAMSAIFVLWLLTGIAKFIMWLL